MDCLHSHTDNSKGVASVSPYLDEHARGLWPRADLTGNRTEDQGLFLKAFHSLTELECCSSGCAHHAYARFTKINVERIPGVEKFKDFPLHGGISPLKRK